MKYGVHNVFKSLVAVTLSFDLLTQSVCRRTWYIHHLILLKLTQIFTKILYSAGFCCDLDLSPMILKANQHIYEPKYIRNKNWAKFPSLVCEIWCSQRFQIIGCCDLDVWPSDPISMSQDLIHTSPNVGEINTNIYEHIVFTLFFGSLPAVTLTFNLWSQ